MTIITIQPSEHIYKLLEAFAQRENVSIEEMVLSILKEKLTEQTYRLEKCAKRGSREKFEAALAKVPDVEPEDYDRL